MPRLLVVDDEPLFLRAVVRLIAGWAEFEISCVDSPQAAIQSLALAEGPHVLLFDICLPGEEDCLPLVAAANARSMPPGLVAMSGRAHRSMVADLLKAGVHDYWEKWCNPFELRLKLNGAVTAVRAESGRSEDATLHAVAWAEVGARSLRDAQTALGDAMIDLALRRAGGNRSVAARMLGVTPQAIRHRERARRARDAR